jgi:hypothetical protein
MNATELSGRIAASSGSGMTEIVERGCRFAASCTPTVASFLFSTKTSLPSEETRAATGRAPVSVCATTWREAQSIAETVLLPEAGM